MIAPGTARRLGWLLFVLSLVLAMGSVLFGLVVPAARTGLTLAQASPAGLLPVGLTLLGVLIVSRQPYNPIGWMFVGIGVSVSTTFVASTYFAESQAHRAGLPGAAIAAWYENLLDGPVIFGGFTFLFLLFPNGHLPSPRWKPLAWVSGAATVGIFAVSAFRPGPLGDYPTVQNPFGLGIDSKGLDGPQGLIFFLLMACLLASVVSLVLRFLRSHGEERQQLKVFATATVFSGVLLLCGPLFWFVFPAPLADLWNVAFVLAVVILPVAIAVSMLKYRLYDIDVIISRALVYGPLTAAIAAVYVGGVIGLQALSRAAVGQHSDLAIAIVTLAVAALFNPLRRHLQLFVDRRFYRRKYDAARTLAALSTRLRDEVDLDRMAGELTSVVQETMQPASVSLWLREGQTS
jgi:hypothetical protein